MADWYNTQVMEFVVTMELDGTVAPDYTHALPDGHTYWVDQETLDELTEAKQVCADVEPILQRCRLTTPPPAAGCVSTGTSYCHERVWTATSQYGTGGTLLDLSVHEN